MAMLLAANAQASPPADADPTLKPWFDDLRQPGTGRPCCSIADCRRAEYRIQNGGYEVLILGLWIPVPQDRVLDRNDNPTGHAVVCWLPTIGVMCFIRAPDA
ncbi:hypothetical protein [Limobrevibacterium gyesilva]|nr:hypothetical protein [Limobrevibacterium gyesilva]